MGVNVHVDMKYLGVQYNAAACVILEFYTFQVLNIQISNDHETMLTVCSYSNIFILGN